MGRKNPSCPTSLLELRIRACIAKGRNIGSVLKLILILFSEKLASFFLERTIINQIQN